MDPEYLAALVAREYALEVTGCVLLRSLVNDVYRIDTPSGPYAFKLYRTGHNSAEWETSLAAYVGTGLTQGVALQDGRMAGAVQAAEGPRAFTLWEWAPGAKPGRPRTDELYHRFGAATAAFHEASTGFPGPPALDVLTLLDDVLARIPAASDRALIAGLATEAGRRAADPNLERGICHGDVTLDNIHLDGDDLVFYDLDRAAHGIRATDLSPVSATPQWPAFLAGYRTVRPFLDSDVAVLPWLDVLLRVDYLHFHLYAKPAIRGTESLTEGWVEDNLVALRTSATRLR
ncbi:aminoglycoside phosphotransferase [Actinoplanes friuliensis DSM 7358]|uniref:Aminoglycoside phosphotransferase n=1 Tax=Actinoplanes friuliensis DSM 7358 TaxID=1246995 RepID=U5VT42_9ACTN|nr:aminoglycoside phosphotransferase [Actinoplanes friuliensis DSM 7358]